MRTGAPAIQPIAVYHAPYQTLTQEGLHAFNLHFCHIRINDQHISTRQPAARESSPAILSRFVHDALIGVEGGLMA